MNEENSRTASEKQAITQPMPNNTAYEFLYLYKLIRYRIEESFSSEDVFNKAEPEMPLPHYWEPNLYKFIMANAISREGQILLLIALAPYLYPDLFDRAIAKELPPKTEEFTNIGGTRGKNCRFFLPTGETAVFLIAGRQLRKRLVVQELFGSTHIFWLKKVLWLEDMQNTEPPMHGRIIMSQDYIDILTTGEHQSPQFSVSFPAKKISPSEINRQPDWEQLVINAELKSQINEIKTWLEYNDDLVKKFASDNRFRKGYRALFFGPPGTGKTFTARLLGDEFRREVFKIDLSMVVSKYIGETEKNLELLFTRAEDKKWILFFDEADALFGKRTNVRDAHDKYANQEVSYLLQRIEDYDGLIILATNWKNNIDDAFIRRFNSILRFPIPNEDERREIWEKLFPEKTVFLDKPGSEEKVPNVFDKIKSYELTGGNINNIVHFACLQAFGRRGRSNGVDHTADANLKIYMDDILTGIRKEMVKEGKPFA
ncbi:MAG: ATP-binding protein [Chitinophagaceae bacterium]|nr:ATP-binding protein [Chitinophagaceae bacterium]